MSVEDGIPEGGQATPEPTHDWERDYKALQAEYTRSQQSLKEWDDEQTALSRFAEKFPHLVAQGEEEQEDEYEYQEEPAAPQPPPPDPRIDWLAARESERQYESDLKTLVGDREVTARGKKWIESRSKHIAETTKKAWGAESLEEAVKDYFELVDEVRGPTRRAAPTPPQPGKAAEVNPNTLKDPEARRRARREKIAAQIEAGTQ